MPETTRAYLKRRHSILKSWRLLSRELGGVNKGLLNAIANGKKKAPSSVRQAVRAQQLTQGEYEAWKLENQEVLDAVLLEI